MKLLDNRSVQLALLLLRYFCYRLAIGADDYCKPGQGVKGLRHPDPLVQDVVLHQISTKQLLHHPCFNFYDDISKKESRTGSER